MGNLQIDIILIINASQENGKPPSRNDIKRSVSLQVDDALDRLVHDGLVNVDHDWRYRLADNADDALTHSWPLLRRETF